jgi:hypothetical protein
MTFLVLHSNTETEDRLLGEPLLFMYVQNVTYCSARKVECEGGRVACGGHLWVSVQQIRRNNENKQISHHPFLACFVCLNKRFKMGSH